MLTADTTVLGYGLCVVGRFQRFGSPQRAAPSRDSGAHDWGCRGFIARPPSK